MKCLVFMTEQRKLSYLRSFPCTHTKLIKHFLSDGKWCLHSSIDMMRLRLWDGGTSYTQQSVLRQEPTITPFLQFSRRDLCGDFEAFMPDRVHDDSFSAILCIFSHGQQPFYLLQRPVTAVDGAASDFQLIRHKESPIHSVLFVMACLVHSSILPEAMTMRTANPRNSRWNTPLGSRVPAGPLHCSYRHLDMAIEEPCFAVG